MSQGTHRKMRESRDAAGRTTLELRDELPKALLACCVLSVLPVLAYGWAALYFTLAMLLVFGSLSTWYALARRRMQVTIDPAARTLAVESGPRQRVLPLAEVQRAQAAAGARAGSGSYRVELALRSGELLPLYVGLGGFAEEDCRALAERINQAL